MAFRKRRKRRFTRKRGKRWRRRPRGGLGSVSLRDAAYGAMAGVRYIKSVINVEKKMKDLGATASASTTPLVYCLNDMAQGVTDSTRVGNSLKAQSVAITGSITWDTTGTQNRGVRMMLLWDNQQVADTAPTSTEIFGSATPSLWSHLNPESHGRLIIVADRTVYQSTDKLRQPLKVIRRLSRHVRFNGAATTDLQKNGLFWVIYSNEATNTPSVQFQSFFRYVDN